MSETEMLRIAHDIVTPHGLRAELIPGARSVGVQGDHRSYTPVLCLIGPFPGHEKLAELSTRISNVTPINHVTFEIPPITQFPQSPPSAS